MQQLARAAERLQQIEQLLLCPTLEAIRESEALLEQTMLLIAEHRDQLSERARTDSDRGIGHGERAMANRLRVACERVMKLLEGARRAQWIRLRLITCLTQTYTARAEVKTWSPPGGSINLRM